LGLDRLLKTFLFISFTISKTVGWTPWTSDQLVAKPLLNASGDFDDGEVGGMNCFGRGNRRHFVHHKSHMPELGVNPDRRGGKSATNRFSYGAANIYIIAQNI
jgi:hypothetical protein